ncbi:tetratricopeptide repeat protein [Actinocorallia longicatena]|uniref:Tetratricopeptide repeat protein n=1 Tax=Actinocorallia longicatena TaxID=111803 RepID=A0ABP6PZD6_9ACTN
MADHESHPLSLRCPPLGATETQHISGWTEKGNETTRIWDEHRLKCRLELGECLRHHVTFMIVIHDHAEDGGLRERAEAEYMRGVLAHRQGDAPRAADHYRTAASLLDALGDGKAVGHALTALGLVKLPSDPTGALASLQAAASRLPGDPVVQTAIGRALWRAGRRQAALAVLDAVPSSAHQEANRVKGEILAEFSAKGA